MPDKKIFEAEKKPTNIKADQLISQIMTYAKQHHMTRREVIGEYFSWKAAWYLTCGRGLSKNDTKEVNFSELEKNARKVKLAEGANYGINMYENIYPPIKLADMDHTAFLYYNWDKLSIKSDARNNTLRESLGDHIRRFKTKVRNCSEHILFDAPEPKVYTEYAKTPATYEYSAPESAWRTFTAAVNHYGGRGAIALDDHAVNEMKADPFSILTMRNKETVRMAGNKAYRQLNTEYKRTISNFTFKETADFERMKGKASVLLNYMKGRSGPEAQTPEWKELVNAVEDFSEEPEKLIAAEKSAKVLLAVEKFTKGRKSLYGSDMKNEMVKDALKALAITIPDAAHNPNVTPLIDRFNDVRGWRLQKKIRLGNFRTTAATDIAPEGLDNPYFQLGMHAEKATNAYDYLNAETGDVQIIDEMDPKATIINSEAGYEEGVREPEIKEPEKKEPEKKESEKKEPEKKEPEKKEPEKKEPEKKEPEKKVRPVSIEKVCAGFRKNLNALSNYDVNSKNLPNMKTLKLLFSGCIALSNAKPLSSDPTKLDLNALTDEQIALSEDPSVVNMAEEFLNSPEARGQIKDIAINSLKDKEPELSFAKSMSKMIEKKGYNKLQNFIYGDDGEDPGLGDDMPQDEQDKQEANDEQEEYDEQEFITYSDACKSVDPFIKALKNNSVDTLANIKKNSLITNLAIIKALSTADKFVLDGDNKNPVVIIKDLNEKALEYTKDPAILKIAEEFKKNESPRKKFKEYAETALTRKNPQQSMITQAGSFIQSYTVGLQRLNMLKKKALNKKQAEDPNKNVINEEPKKNTVKAEDVKYNDKREPSISSNGEANENRYTPVDNDLVL